MSAPETSGQVTLTCPKCGAIDTAPRTICPRCGAKLGRAALEYPPGSIIDEKYEVVSLLGVGGMGEVYKTRHLHLNSYRCIKVMRRNLLTDETFRMRFIREARVATQIQHPNVAVLHDFSTLPDGSYYMVWEFIDGTTLRQWARAHGRFPVDAAIEIGLQVLSGLDYCHRRGLIHRDISPDNIMIANDEEDLIVKIIDLGIAKEVASTHGDHTQVGLFVGNLKYSSPEQLGELEEGEVIDGRSDLYSLGVVLYEILLGVPLFQSQTPQGYVIKHLTQTPPRFREVDPNFDVDPALEEIVFTALEKDRAKRFASAREFSAALRKFQLTWSAAHGQATVDGRQRSRKLMLAAQNVVPRTIEQPSPERAAAASEPSAAPTREERPDDETALFNAALAEDSVEAWQQFLTIHPGGARTKEARERLERAVAAAEEMAAYSAAMESGSPEDLRAFLQKYPQSAMSESARRTIDEAADLAAARTADDERVWSAFLENWSGGRHVSEAHRRIEVLRQERAAFEGAVAAGTSIALRQFVERFRNGARARKAEEMLGEALAWEGLANGTIEQLDAFISKHPLGAHVAAARAAKRRLAEQAGFEAARAADSVESWRRFLADFPGDEERQQHARARLDAFELAASQSAFESRSVDELKLFLEQFPGSVRASEARAILRTAQGEKDAADFLASDGSVDAARAVLAFDADAMTQLIARAEQQGKAEHLSTLAQRADLGALRRSASEARGRLLEKQKAREAETAEWAATEQVGTAKAWQAFAENHADSIRVVEARRREREAREYEALIENGSMAALEAYIATSADPGRTATATRRLIELQKKFVTPLPRGSEGLWKHGPNVSEISSGAAGTMGSSQPDAEEIQTISLKKNARIEVARGEAPAPPPAAIAPISEPELDATMIPSSQIFAPRPPKPAPAPTPQPLQREAAAAIAPMAAPAPMAASAPAVAAEPAFVPPVALPLTAAEVAPKRRRIPRVYYLVPAIALLVVLVIVGGAVVMVQKANQPKPAAPPAMSALVADARPWAQVTSVKDASGKEWLGAAKYTPLSLSVPVGDYRVTFANPESPEPRVVSVKVVAAGTAVCEADFHRVDLTQYFSEAGWK